MSVDITEFVEIDPDRVDAVFKAANGTPFLMIKQVGDDDADDKPEEDEEPDAEGKATKELQFCGDPTCEICVGRAAKGKLKMSERRRIPKGDFALPEKAPDTGSYPINDRAHARAALRMRGHASPEEQARIKRAVAAKYPDLGKGKKGKKQKKASKAMPGQVDVEQSFHGMKPSADAQMGQTTGNQRGQSTNTDVQSDRPSGKPKSLEAGSIPQEGTGFGRTARDKVSFSPSDPQGAERQTEEDSRQNASKETADMKGSTLEDKGKSTDEKSEATGAQSQTEANMRRNQPSGSDGIRDQMTRQNAQAQKAFKFKVKKGGKKKKKKNAPLEISGAMKQSGPERVISEALASKEFETMTGAELAEVISGVLDAREARKAEEREAKKAKAKKKAKKRAKKSGATTPEGNGEAAQEAAKSISPEKLVEGIGARVEAALKEAVAPLWGRMQNLENQPARSRPALNNLAGTPSQERDQRNPNGNVMDVLKPLEDAFKSEKDPYQREKLGGELTKAKLVIAERIRHGQPVSAADAAVLAAKQ